MTSSNPLREFLVSRRAQIEPESVGLRASPVPRRRPGLRREEVAALAGVSVDYYARLEQGRIGNVSDQVLTAIEDALRLDPLEREHLRGLVSSGPAKPRRSRPIKTRVRDSVRALVEAVDPVPALLQGPRMDILAWNRSASVLLADFATMAPEDRNVARWLFLDRSTRERYPDWEEVATSTVAALRANRDPLRPDEALERLVGELSVASDEFARYWADYRLFKHGHGKKRLYHPTVGVMTLNYETLNIADSAGQFVSTYTADVGSPSEERLNILLSWSQELAGADVEEERYGRQP
ncbi:helix-turn-helix transcriptional regulator [Amycolatopsis jiangsuensis]|uniref:Transcriptional regulator with XRE-family HTH domain n=1 Tax=Amycolatopsis jiangsuensis TaxID=1181879 RepID=A0A840J771_9PSEU|nr:helix-turn-helix transcriptional regulator [Amycolatopsis jiangsuensis]MBB4689559.1 transcriptional regulator with XRE-family HTH domain [Amycolatopsis jiangsuensis]